MEFFHKAIRSSSSHVKDDVEWAMSFGTEGQRLLVELLDTARKANVYGEDEPAYKYASHALRGAVKAHGTQIIGEAMSEEFDLDNVERANKLFRTWAISANDNIRRSVELQAAAAEELGVSLSDWQKARAGKGDLATPHDSMTISHDQKKAFVRAVYRETQAQLARAGIESDGYVTLYRGIGLSPSEISSWEPGKAVDYTGNAVESWALDSWTAEQFAGLQSGKRAGTTPVVLRMSVPVENIVAMATVGWGCFTEGECLIMGTVPGQVATVTEIAH
jgi:hypothetical protein